MQPNAGQKRPVKTDTPGNGTLVAYGHCKPVQFTVLWWYSTQRREPAFARVLERPTVVVRRRLNCYDDGHEAQKDSPSAYCADRRARTLRGPRTAQRPLRHEASRSAAAPEGWRGGAAAAAPGHASAPLRKEAPALSAAAYRQDRLRQREGNDHRRAGHQVQ